ncbi:MAG: HlyD family secretion protein [Gammaproteobacteria bacterium]
MSAQAAPAKAAHRRRRVRRMCLRTLLLIVVPIAAVLTGGHYYIKGGRFVETENAYVKAHIITVSADVDGRVEWVGVESNQSVEAGQPLFRIDAEPFLLKVQQGEAEMQMARTEIDSLREEYREVLVEAKEARQRVSFLRKQFERQQQLQERRLGRQEDYDEAESALQVARQRVRVTEQRARRVLAGLVGDEEMATQEHPRFLQAKALRDQAAVDLARTSVLAPAAGIVSNMGLQAGEYLEQGDAAFTLIASSALWVEANLKETDLTHIKEGQSATLVVDAYSDREWNAFVDTIAPATGSEFALLPPQNASGNWVKVVQRVPVRLRLDEAADASALRAGMTVTVRIDTEHRRELPAFARAWIESEKVPAFIRGILRTALAVPEEPGSRPTLDAVASN